MFHAEALRVLGTHPDWLSFNLARGDGIRIADASNPPGRELGPVVDRESFDLAMRTGELVIGRILLGPEGRNLGIPLRMPVHNEDGTVRYVVTVVLKPDAFG